jgi:hypothetical protein
MPEAGQHTQAPKQQTPPNRGGAEQPEKDAKEMSEAFAKELAKGITAAETAGDPEVMVAFTLGWQMSELYKPGSWRGQDAKPEEDLPGLGHLGGKERAQLGLKQIEVGLKTLETKIKSSGLPAPTVTEATAAVPTKFPDAAYEKAIFELHVNLLTTLTAAHFKLGKAYGLGRSLADTTRLPKDLATLKRKLKGPRIANLTAWLSDLTSLFPPHAGHVVHGSLEAWREWAASATEDPENKSIALLRRQGQRWRSLLSGEKNAADALSPKDYVEAGELTITQTGKLAWEFLEKYKRPLGLAAFLFVVGLGLVIWDPTGGSLAGGLATIIASLGLTWKGVGSSLGTTAAKIERPIWQSALDTQITTALGLIPGTTPAKRYVAPTPKMLPTPTDNETTTAAATD